MKKFKEIIEDCEIINILTHDGVCHTDDCMVAALIRIMAGEYGKKVNIVRTRDEAVLLMARENENTIIFDVGNGELDHHREDDVVDGRPLSSIGKVWRWMHDEICETFHLDEKGWVEIDRNLILYVDRTDNTGDMNPLNYAINSIRYINGGSTEEAFEKCTQYLEVILRAALETAGRMTEQRKMFDALPIVEIAGRRFKINEDEKFIPAGEAEPDVFGYIWKCSESWKIKSMNKNFFKPNIMAGEVEGVIFTHKGGWLGEVKTLEDIEKILPE